MANRQHPAEIIAAEALAMLDNELVMANLVYRAEDGFSKSVNGFRVGETVNFPLQFEVREGATEHTSAFKRIQSTIATIAPAMNIFGLSEFYRCPNPTCQFEGSSESGRN